MENNGKLFFTGMDTVDIVKIYFINVTLTLSN
jgi:hypothetical protein